MNIIKSYIVTNAAASQAGGGLTSFSVGNLSPLFTASLGADPLANPALTFTAVNQNANLVYAGPATGVAAAPTFRALVAADIPLTSTQVAFGDGSNKISSSANLTFASSTNVLTVNTVRIVKNDGGGATPQDGVSVGPGAGYTGTFTVSQGANTSLGRNTLMSLVDGAFVYESSYNTAIGDNVMNAATTQSQNTGVGARVFSSASYTGFQNTAVGAFCMTNTTTGNGNTMVGYNVAGTGVVTGTENSFLGRTIAAGLTSGARNTAIGNGPLSSLTTGSNNTVGGSEAFEFLTTQSHNTGWGYWAGVYNKGNYNVAIGAFAMGQTDPSTVGTSNTASQNTIVGPNAGRYIVDGDYNVWLGYDTGTAAIGEVYSNTVAIGKAAKVTASNSFVLGGVIDANANNYGFGGESFGGGSRVTFYKKAVTNPTGAPTDGFILYSDVTNGDAYIWNAADGAAFKLGAGGSGWAVTGTTTITGNTVVDFGATGTSPYTNEFRADNLTTTVTVGRGLVLNNNTAATGGATVQYSPSLTYRGRAWTGAASQTVDFKTYVLTASAATPTGQWILASSINGGADVVNIRVNNNGAALGVDFNAGGFNISGTTNALLIGAGNTTLRGGGSSSLQLQHNNTSVIPSSTFGISLKNLNAAMTFTSGTAHEVAVASGYTVASGTGVYNAFTVNPTINQTSTASGAITVVNITPTYTSVLGTLRGIYYNPTVTSVTGVHYSFEATSGLMALNASTTTSASFRIVHGSAPSSPVDGDIWTTTAGLFVRINGSTVGPLS